MSIFSERLKELRAEKGLSCKQASEMIGLSRNAISNYEQGIREPSIDTIKDLCKLFECTSDYLLGIEDN